VAEKSDKRFIHTQSNEALRTLCKIRKELKGLDNEGLYDLLVNSYQMKTGATQKSSAIENLWRTATWFSIENSKAWECFRKDSVLEIKSLLVQLPESLENPLEKPPERFDFKSANDELIPAAANAHRCILLNTFIDFDEWSTPIIQMHNFVLKCIAEQVNYRNIAGCLSANQPLLTNRGVPRHKVNTLALTACVKNPPSYRNFRFTFLPMSFADYRSKLDNDTGFRKEVEFISQIHELMGVKLAFIPIDYLLDIIDNNREFFSEKTCESLGLSELYRELDNTEDKLRNNVLKTALDSMRLKKEELTSKALDYMFIDEQEIAGSQDVKGSVWVVGYDSHFQYLKYKRLAEDTMQVSIEDVSIRMKLAQLLYNEVIGLEETLSKNLLKSSDPYYHVIQLNRLKIERIGVNSKYKPIG